MLNKNTIQPEPMVPISDVPDETFGKLAVLRDQESLSHELNRDHAVAELAEITQREHEIAKRPPAADKAVANFIGRMTGKVMTPLEKEQVDPKKKNWLTHNVENSSLHMERIRKSRDDFIHEARGALQTLNVNQKLVADEFLNKSTAPSIFRQYDERAKHEDSQERTGNWIDWLATSATDEQLLNFLQWHVNTVAKQQESEVVKTAIERERTEYKTEIAKGVSQGWLHPETKAIEKTDDINILLGDAFTTVVNQWGGYHIPGSNSIVIAQGDGLDPLAQDRSLVKYIKHATKHELNHAVLGQLPYRWLNEAVTENIAQILKSGGIQEYDETYLPERKLLDSLIVKGKSVVSAKLATLAYSDPQGEEGESYHQFTDALDKAWGVQDVLGKLADEIEVIEETVCEMNPTLPLHEVQTVALERVRATLLKRPEKIFLVAA
jgi:hypothetical protein